MIILYTGGRDKNGAPEDSKSADKGAVPIRESGVDDEFESGDAPRKPHVEEKERDKLDPMMMTRTEGESQSWSPKRSH
ncbi:hypothetical protein ACLOJK_031269 [Asimina triloba]